MPPSDPPSTPNSPLTDQDVYGELMHHAAGLQRAVNALETWLLALTLAGLLLAAAAGAYLLRARFDSGE